eukprot:gene782-10512_t
MDVNLFVRQFWRDHRLDLSLNRSEWKAFGIEAFKDIWVPEVYFPAAKKGKWHDLMKPNTALHIHHGGEIFLSRGGVALYLKQTVRIEKWPFQNVAVASCFKVPRFTTIFLAAYVK